MQLLKFRTVTKTTTLYSNSSKDIETNTLSEFSFDNVSTVAIRDGFYEIMVKKTVNSNAIPVARLPIANTNMLIMEE